MNEDYLNIEIRKFLKKVGISSQRELESHIKQSIESGSLKIGDNVELEMRLIVKNQDTEHIIADTITIE